jgi:hypothetical protein
MRWTLAISIVAAVLGVSLGLSLTWAELGPYWRAPPGVGLGDVSGDPEIETDRPHPHAVVVDSDTFNFGHMQQDAHGHHTFEIRNEGGAPLSLIKGSTSCKCTLSELADNLVQPGESAKVHLEWSASVGEGEFRHHATVRTNDPRRPVITLTIEGHISRSHKVAPRELLFSSIDVGKGASGEVFIYAYDSDSLAIIRHEYLQSASAQYFDLQIEDMKAELLNKEEGAKAGKIVRVVVKPGLPLGELRQRIRLVLDLPGEPTVELSVDGHVIGDIAIVGPSPWDDSLSALNLGVVKSDEGFRSSGMYLLAKGDHRDQLDLKVHEIRPDILQIEFEAPQPLPDQELVKVPFTVVVPPGAAAGAHNGTFDAPAGRIDIDTGHPTTPRLRLFVLFSVVK